MRSRPSGRQRLFCFVLGDFTFRRSAMPEQRGTEPSNQKWNGVPKQRAFSDSLGSPTANERFLARRAVYGAISLRNSLRLVQFSILSAAMLSFARPSSKGVGQIIIWMVRRSEKAPLTLTYNQSHLLANIVNVPPKRLPQDERGVIGHLIRLHICNGDGLR